MFAIYVRVSEVRGREGESFGSPEEQESAARARAEILGLDVEDEPIVELDTSGKTDAADRELGRLVERCEENDLDGIIFNDLDRFSRDRLSGGMTLRRLRECGARAIFVRQGIDYPSGSDLVINILLDVADDQWTRLCEARLRGQQRAIERGLHLSNRAPFGYRWTDRQKGGRIPSEGGGIGRLEPDPKLAPKVQEAFRRRSDGVSYEKLAKLLGVKGKSSARAIILNRVYLGEVNVPGEDKPKANAHKPLVTIEEWERANAQGNPNAARTGRWTGKTLLNGIVRCDGCKRPLAVGTSRGKPYYSCTAEGCTKRTGIRATELDAHVNNLVMQASVAKEPEVVAILEGDDRYQRALDAVEAARDELETYRRDVKVSIVGAAAFERDVLARKQALKLTRDELRKVPQMKPTVVPMNADIAVLTAATDRDTFTRLVDRVMVKQCGRGKIVPAVERTEVWFVGATKPYKVKAAKVSRNDAAIIERHLAEAA